jgi:glutathione S-transferase
MAEYQLYCFAQSGNAYRAALMLSVIGADWEPIFVDFFKAGVQRTAEFRETINEMGEAPVLIHGTKKLSQSGVILTYLAERSGKFLPRSDDERLEALRWIIFDNQKIGGALGPYRFLHNFAKPPGHPAVMEFLMGPGRQRTGHPRQAPVAWSLHSRRRADHRRHIADQLSLLSVRVKFGFDIAAQHKNIGAWLDRMKALPGWAHPYDLMPGHPLPQ